MAGAREVYDLIVKGRQISSEEASRLEEELGSNSNNVDARISLLGYYGSNRFQSPKLRAARIPHIAWFVDNEPDHEVLSSWGEVIRDMDGRSAYADIKSRWLRQTEKDVANTGVLENAASFFTLDDRHLAEKLLIRARDMEPNECRWPSRLASLYRLWGSYYETRALAECIRAIELSPDSQKLFYEFTSLPELAFAAGRIAEAEDGAWRLLKMAKEFRGDWNYGNALNAAHTTLGRIALRNGDLEKAKFHLFESAKDVASPQTKSFGPDRQLAAELLDVGETEAVLKYWDLCETFWRSGREDLKLWRKKLAAGESPLTYLLERRHRFFDLITKPRALYNDKRHDEAKKAAEDLLKLSDEHADDVRHYGYAVHVANIVLGQLALQAGDVPLAKEYLRKAGAAPLSQRLSERGPDLSLAADLASAGEKAVVLKFLKQVKRYQKGEGKVDYDAWILQAEKGELSPDLLW
jgi:tetratricopeptide (TPR) repeat protein